MLSAVTTGFIRIVFSPLRCYTSASLQLWWSVAYRPVLRTMFVPLSNPSPQCDCIRNWGLWELTRIRTGHEGRAP